MSSEETNALEANKALIQRLCDEVLNQANHDTAMEILSPDYRITGPGHRDLWFELEATSTGPEGAIALIERYRDTYQDVSAEIEHVAAEGDVVVTIFRIECRGGEEQSIAVTAIVANYISGGKIEHSVAGYEIEDLLGGHWRLPWRR